MSNMEGKVVEEEKLTDKPKNVVEDAANLPD